MSSTLTMPRPGAIWSGVVLVVLAAAAGCQPKPPPGTASGNRDYHVAMDDGVPIPPRSARHEGLLAFERAGDVYVTATLGEDHTARRLVPPDGDSGPATGRCPTFLPDGRLMVIEPQKGLWVFDPMTGKGRKVLASPDLVALGVDRSTQEPLVGVIDPESQEPWQDVPHEWYAARLANWTTLEPIGVADSTPVGPQVGDQDVRLRTSRYMEYIAVPRYRTGTGAPYFLCQRRTRYMWSIVPWSLDNATDWGAWYASRAAGLDFGLSRSGKRQESIYIALLEPPPVAIDHARSGIYELPEGDPSQGSWLVLRDGPSFHELAASEALGIIAASTWRQDTGAICVIRLSDGETLRTVQGEHPDVWPRYPLANGTEDEK